jgi:Fic/DOC family N-terminal
VEVKYQVRGESFGKAQQRHVVRTLEGYLAFVPPPLPPDVRLDRALVAKLSAADRALGQLAGAARTLLNPHLVASVLVRREAVLSSRIEGTRASLSDLVLFEAQPSRHDPTGDVREVLNHGFMIAESDTSPCTIGGSGRSYRTVPYHFQRSWSATSRSRNAAAAASGGVLGRDQAWRPAAA